MNRKAARSGMYHLRDYGDNRSAYVCYGPEYAHLFRETQLYAAHVHGQPPPPKPDPIDERAELLLLLDTRPEQPVSEMPLRLAAAARILILKNLKEARRSYTASLYDWPDRLPAPLTWPIAEVSRLMVIDGERSPHDLRRLWMALQLAAALPHGPRFWVGSVSARGQSEALETTLAHWPRWPDSQFQPRYDYPADEPPAKVPKLPAHWRLFAKAQAKALAIGRDPDFGHAADALLAIDWSAASAAP